MDILSLFGISFSGMMMDFITSIFNLILGLVAGLLGVDPIPIE